MRSGERGTLRRVSGPASGIETLLEEHADWLAGRRVGLVAHAASVDGAGVPTPVRLLRAGVRLAAILGPEHGFGGAAGAGESVADGRYRAEGADIPVFSLYGATRRPVPEMLRDVDVLVYDLQDLGVRCYTYLSTLRYVLEAGATAGKPVIVADRPVPLPCCVDGPPRADGVESFVAAVPAPLVLGMTPGESARWLCAALGIAVDLRVAPLAGYVRGVAAWLRPAHWVRPSPGIRTPETACLYPASVMCEALPALDYGRGQDDIFRVCGAPWLDAVRACEALAAMRLPGVRFAPTQYVAAAGAHAGQGVQAVRLALDDGDAFRPARTAVAILSTLQTLHGADRIWNHPGTRPAFFDELMGTAAVRTALRAGVPWGAMAESWEPGLAGFRDDRRRHLLYAPCRDDGRRAAP